MCLSLALGELLSAQILKKGSEQKFGSRKLNQKHFIMVDKRQQ